MSLSKTLTIENKLGLHARAASLLAQTAAQFKAKITLEKEGKTADAASVLAVMLLEGSQGKQVTVHCEGEDQAAALDAICALFAAKFNEQ